MSGLKNPSLSLMWLGISFQLGAIRVSMGRISECPKRKAAVANSLKIPGLHLVGKGYIYHLFGDPLDFAPLHWGQTLAGSLNPIVLVYINFLAAPFTVLQGKFKWVHGDSLPCLAL